jgi:hypothetical protein
MSEHNDGDLARRILHLTSSLETNCREELDLPYRRDRAGRVLKGACSAMLVGAIMLGGTAFAAGAPAPVTAAGSARTAQLPAANGPVISNAGGRRFILDPQSEATGDPDQVVTVPAVTERQSFMAAFMTRLGRGFGRLMGIK